MVVVVVMVMVVRPCCCLPPSSRLRFNRWGCCGSLLCCVRYLCLFCSRIRISALQSFL